MRNLKEELDSVQTAIKHIESGGQEVEIEVAGNKRRVRRADLSSLYKERNVLCRQILRAESQGSYFGIPE